MISRESATAPPGPERLFLVGGDRFHQRDELTLHRLILDLAVGPEQPQAERAVQEQQALDLARLVVAVVEEGDGNVERGRDLLQTRSADAIDALLVLLDLLKAHAQLVAELGLRDLLLDTPQPDPFTKLNVGLAGTALLHSLSRCFSHYVSPSFGRNSPRVDGSGVRPCIPRQILVDGQIRRQTMEI